MKKSFVLIASAVTLLFVTLVPSSSSAGGVRVYVGPGYGYGYGYGYPRYSYSHPGYGHSYPRYGYRHYYPRGYTVYRAPKRYVRRRARRYWRRW
jgi:hypothetical protein